ncbi:MAG: fibronectin type III domain-containing protein [Gemmatimonadota bacterium]|nr:fibronectin type III domain-containing protein [Gemmatimonadota bacterium]
MFRIQVLSASSFFLAALLLFGMASPSEASTYTYHWEIANKPEGQERATVVEPVQVVLGSQVVEVADHSASLQLMQRYSVHLEGAWSASQAHSLFQTFESVPQEKNDPYGKSKSIPPSLWTLSDRHLENDIELTIQDGQRHVTIAEEAFRYAQPLLAEIEGVQGRFFSKRLHRAVVRFVTDHGEDRQALERILSDRYGVSLKVEDYGILTRHTTNETASRFEQFKDEELIAIASMFEEFPQGMLHTPGLDFLVRRKDGLPHPLYPAAPAVAWPKEGYIEFMESAFKETGPAYIHRLIVHEKAHFLWEHLFDEKLKQDWIELGGWYRNPDGAAGKAVGTLDAPPPPTNLRFSALTDSSCRVRWDASEGATDYDVNYKELGGKWTNEPHRGVRLWNTINNLKPSTTYRWAVRAENEDGASDWVFGSNFTTLADADAVPATISGDPDGWSTTKQTEFVSAYAHGKNPNEDMAESIAYYIVNPDKLRSRSPAKYEFIQNRVMHGTRYISKIRADLTFQVYNLYPDVVYPGRIIRVDITVEGKPREDKHVTIELELHQESDQDAAEASHLRIFSQTGSFFDLWLNPIDKNGRRVNSSHILRGEKTLSKFAADGYWRTDQITLRDAQGNERHESQADFGWKLFVDNPLADSDPPYYVPKSMKLSLSEATEEGRPYQVLTARWKLLEENGIKGVLAQLNDSSDKTYSRRAENWGDYNEQTKEATVELKIPNYYPGGVWKLNYILMEDDGLNMRGVYFTHPGHGLRDEQEVIDEQPASIEIITTNPDTTPPKLDLNKITIQAESTNPTAPNGETQVDISFRVKDNNSGYRSTDMLLRDPQGTEHFYRHYREDYYSVYFKGDPTVWKTYKRTIVLPVGSIPGTWGLAYMTVWDKAQNRFQADFTEIVRFEVKSGSAKQLALASKLLLEQNAPNPFNSQTILSYFLPKFSFVRLELINLLGQHVATLYQGDQAAGYHQFHWDGKDSQGRGMASGTYLYRLVTDQGVLMRKLTLLR